MTRSFFLLISLFDPFGYGEDTFSLMGNSRLICLGVSHNLVILVNRHACPIRIAAGAIYRGVCISRCYHNGSPMVHGCIELKNGLLLAPVGVLGRCHGANRFIDGFALEPDAAGGVQKLLHLRCHIAEAGGGTEDGP